MGTLGCDVGAEDECSFMGSYEGHATEQYKEEKLKEMDFAKEQKGMKYIRNNADRARLANQVLYDFDDYIYHKDLALEQLMATEDLVALEAKLPCEEELEIGETPWPMDKMVAHLNEKLKITCEEVKKFVEKTEAIAAERSAKEKFSWDKEKKKKIQAAKEAAAK